MLLVFIYTLVLRALGSVRISTIASTVLEKNNHQVIVKRTKRRPRKSYCKNRAKLSLAKEMTIFWNIGGLWYKQPCHTMTFKSKNQTKCPNTLHHSLEIIPKCIIGLNIEQITIKKNNSLKTLII